MACSHRNYGSSSPGSAPFYYDWFVVFFLFDLCSLAVEPTTTCWTGGGGTVSNPTVSNDVSFMRSILVYADTPFLGGWHTNRGGMFMLIYIRGERREVYEYYSINKFAFPDSDAIFIYPLPAVAKGINDNDCPAGFSRKMRTSSKGREGRQQLPTRSTLISLTQWSSKWWFSAEFRRSQVVFCRVHFFLLLLAFPLPGGNNLS